MTRAVGVVRLLIVLAAFAAGSLAAVPTPRSASEGSPTDKVSVDEGHTAPSPVLPVRFGTPDSTVVERGGLRATKPPGPRSTAGNGSPKASPAPISSRKPAKPAPLLRPVAAGIAHILEGQVSWFCLPGRSACTHGFQSSGMFAAAGPAIRAALGPGWMGRSVVVSTGRVSVRVKLIDWCGCPDGRLLDLYAVVYGQLDALSSGLLDVRVEL